MIPDTPARPPARAPGPAHDAEHPSKPQRVRAYRALWSVGLATFVADQVTKSMIAGRLPFGSYGRPAHLEVIPGFFNLVHVGNTGAAWSMFTGQSLWLALLAVATLAAMFWWRRMLGLNQPAAQPAFGLLTGGIVGNLVDRLQHGHVIDFLDFHFGAYVFPTFNVADSAICVGVFWYVLWSLRQPADAVTPG